MQPQPTLLRNGPAYRLQDNDLLLGEYSDHYLLKVKDLPSDQKPREKLTRLGPKSLNVAELVAFCGASAPSAKKCWLWRSG